MKADYTCDVARSAIKMDGDNRQMKADYTGARTDTGGGRDGDHR